MANNNKATEQVQKMELPSPPQTEQRERNILFFIFSHFMADGKDRILDSIEEGLFRTKEGEYILKVFKEYRNDVTGMASAIAQLVDSKDTLRGSYQNWLSQAQEYHYGQEVEECLTDIEIIRVQTQQYEAKLGAANLYYKANQGELSLEDIAEMEARLKKLKESNANKYADLLQDPTEESFYKMMAEAPTGLPVNFEFSNDEGDKKRLIIPSGAVTIVCAPTSHGKSTMLRNIALSMARDQRSGEGRVLYFTFEESEADLYTQLLNTYIGKDLHRPSKTHNNFKTIKEYFVARGKGNAEAVLGYMGGNRDLFLRELGKFQRDYISSGRLKVINKNYDITQLVAAIKYYCNAIRNSGDKVKAVFVDYIQLLSLADRKRLSRPEELKEVCIELKDFSVESHLPVILAAQLNRETKSPLMLFNQNISEASDIEKVANLIICVWNSKFEAQDPTYYGVNKDGKATKANADAMRLEAMGFFAGGAKKYQGNERYINTPENKRNTLYAKITKYRGEIVGLDAVLQWNPNTGKIDENYTPESATPQQQTLDFGDTQTLFSKLSKA